MYIYIYIYIHIYMYIYIYIYMHCINSVKVRTIFTVRPAFQSSQKDVLPIEQQSVVDLKF